ncbi:MAG: MFS transporter [Akkermansia sp.]|nr:MFS transporter [Akkermansia sp.]
MSKYVKGDMTPVVPRRFRTVFFMLVACFALWGLLNNMTDNLVPAFETIFGIKPSESAGVQISFYGAYAVLAIFAAMMVEEFSYRTGVLAGLGFYILGALIYIPACIAQSFDLYLLGIFILAGGLSILETSCNPYVLSLGPEKTAVRRLNFAQAFNPVGSLAGIFLAKYLILANLEGNSKAVQLFWVCVPYVGLIAVAAVIWFFFVRYKEPEGGSEQYETPAQDDTMKTGISKPKLIGMYGLCIAIPVAILVCINTLHVTPKLEEAQKAIAAESAATAALIVTTPGEDGKTAWDIATAKGFTQAADKIKALAAQEGAPAEATELREEVKGKAAALQTELNKSKDDKGAGDVVNKYTDKKLSAKDVSIWGDMVFQLLFVMMGPIVFTLLIKNYREMLIPLLRRPRYWVGVIAQFFYVGVQIAAWTWLNKYCCAQLGIESDVAATYYIISLILFIVCRWIATYYMKKFNPADMMALFAVVAVGCCFGTMYLPTKVLFTIGGLPFSLNIICLILMSGGMSLMFPTIYGIALGGLNSRIVKLGAAGLIMAILGGAVITPWMGSIVESSGSCWLALTPGADSTWDYILSTSDQSVRAAFIVPAICFTVVLVYSLMFRKPLTSSDK